MPGPNDAGFAGQQDEHTGASPFNVLDFMVRQTLGQAATATLVRVEAIDGDTVDVLPLVAQLDGAGQPVPHGTVYGLPFVRLQGGAYAVIIHPVVGDIGVAVFASHDISSVKASRGPANPGSRRRFDMADGVYLGGVLNGTPTQFVRLSPDGVEITSTVKVTVTAPDIELAGTLSINGDPYLMHTHTGVTAGVANSGGVTP